jgi:hypothetical protein
MHIAAESHMCVDQFTLAVRRTPSSSSPMLNSTGNRCWQDAKIMFGVEVPGQVDIFRMVLGCPYLMSSGASNCAENIQLKLENCWPQQQNCATYKQPTKLVSESLGI